MRGLDLFFGGNFVMRAHWSLELIFLALTVPAADIKIRPLSATNFCSSSEHSTSSTASESLKRKSSAKCVSCEL
jgi:hypothetical protein